MTTEPGRDPAFERQFCDQVFRLAGIWNQTRAAIHISDLTRERLVKGRGEYGAGSFLHANLGREIEEEAADVIAWATLASLRARAAGRMEEIEGRAYQAACGVAILLKEYEMRKSAVPA